MCFKTFALHIGIKDQFTLMRLIPVIATADPDQ